ncbi:MAG: nicotinate (nicotinamide) nucleotide adenylyltransferase [Neisseriaceae bacterium]|nr:MAG: nicotinate (nicotinamide) nucleotide adenylyltransferase [Neisseriaceae bacterium]
MLGEFINLKQRIGLFGGTFNPIHNCHILIAEIFIHEMGLDLLIVIPSGYSYHKENNNKNIENNHRYNMCQLAFSAYTKIKISNIDIQRSGNTYTYETIKILRDFYPESEFWWLLGSDSFLELDSWYRYEYLIQMTSFAIALRSPNTEKDIVKKNNTFITPANIKILNIPKCPTSSTKIREGIKNKAINPQWLPKEVEKYIRENKLYV